jgi:hypothetical protein
VASSPTDGMYWQFSIPMGLMNLVQNVIGRNQNNPNTPQLPVPTAQREWFSQPRPASGSPPTITVYSMNDVGQAPTSGATAFASQVASALNVNAQMFTWKPQSWGAPFIYPPAAAASAAVANLTATITATPGKFVLIGHGLGAEVMSVVGQSIWSPYGTMKARVNDLLAGVTFGNPMRQAGHTIGLAGAIDPGGAGINDNQPGVPAVLTNTPTIWWDFAQPDDIVCCCDPDDDDSHRTYCFGRNNFTGQNLDDFGNTVGQALGGNEFVSGDVEDLVNNGVSWI